MPKTIARSVLAAALPLALSAVPGAAHAGTTTDIATVVLNVVNQCTVAGATVNLGSYRTTDSWGTVAAALGSFGTDPYVAGTLGQEHLNFGSVTCDAGVPYSLLIRGTGENGLIRIAVNGKTAILEPHIKRIGGVELTGGPFPGTGPDTVFSGAFADGSGTPQTILGNAPIWTNHETATALLSDTLGVAGTYADALSYTLTF